MSDLERLEVALNDLAGALAFPPTPAIAGRVADSLGRGVARPPVLRWRPMWRAAAIGGLAVVLLAGAAGAIGLGTGSIHIRFGSPPPLPSALASARGFGTEVSLAEARELAAFSIRLPEGDLGQPDHVLFASVPEGGTVSLVWDDRPGYPAGADGVGLVVMEFRADIGPDTFEKTIHSGTTVVTTRVGDEIAWWVEGGEHYLAFVDHEGAPIDGMVRLVGNTLFWERDGLTFRIEGAPSLDVAIQVAQLLALR